MSATLGVDVGGTFTDFFLVDEETGETRTHKVASTPDDPSRAILQGLRALAPGGGLAFLAHGTTVATNALIQRRGGKVALVTTAGFKDLLEIGRQTRPKIYDLKADHPEPLVPREHRFEVAERVGPAGEVIRPLGACRHRARAVADVQASGAESVAVCFLFSFLNPEHERPRRARRCGRRCPAWTSRSPARCSPSSASTSGSPPLCSTPSCSRWPAAT